MPKRPRASTEQVLKAVRADVLGGVYEPGEKLKFADVCARYGASISAVREVLSRMSEQGLIVAEPRVGFRVRTVSLADLRDLTATRIDLESIALRLSIEHGDVDWEATLVSAHHRLDRTPILTEDLPARVSDEWEAAHAQFHAALLAGCGRPRLLTIATSLREGAEFYRRWSQIREPGRDVAAEHREILQAALSRDADAAVRLLAAHYDQTAQILERSLAPEPTSVVDRVGSHEPAPASLRPTDR